VSLEDGSDVPTQGQAAILSSLVSRAEFTVLENSVRSPFSGDLNVTASMAKLTSELGSAKLWMYLGTEACHARR
jgi:hypothetical protein